MILDIAVDELVRKVIIKVIDELERASVPLTKKNVKQASIEKKQSLAKNNVEN